MTNWKQTNIHHSQTQALEARKFEEQQEQLKAIKMKVGYTINAVSNYDNIIEVVNHEKEMR
jgi:hypothetical protein